jgi:uncharacterized protein (DUF4415 family)
MKKPRNKIKKQRVVYTSRAIAKLKDNTDYKKLDQMSEKDIDYSDIPETSKELWAQAELIDPGKKKAISLRVDNDILDWFKSQKGRYQRLINHVLRQYMNTHR